VNGPLGIKSASDDSADASVSISVSNLNPAVGDEFTVSFVATNPGPAAAVRANVSFDVHVNQFDFVSVSGDNCDYTPPPQSGTSDGMVGCGGTDLPAGGQLTGSVTLRVIWIGPNTGVAASLWTGNDPNSSNNLASVDLWPQSAPPTTTISPPPPPTLTNTTLPPATIGEPYSVQLTATGAHPPFTITMDGPNAPPGGLTLSPNGLLSGTPGGIPETITFDIEIWDQQSTQALGAPANVVPLTLTILAEPPIPIPPDTTTTTSTATAAPPVVTVPHLSLIGSRVLSRVGRGQSETTDGWFASNEPLKLTLYVTGYRSNRKLTLLKTSRLGTSTIKKAATIIRATIQDAGSSVEFHLAFHKGTLTHRATYLVHLTGTDARGKVATRAIPFHAI